MSNELDDDGFEDDEFEDDDEVAADGNRATGTRARDSVALIARHLVDDPEGVFVDANERGDTVTLLVHASSGDLGRIIGKRGRVIQSVRQLARAAGSTENVRVTVDVAEQLLLEVGRIGRAHGLHGEVSVVPISNRAERFAPGSELFVGDRKLVITKSRQHQDRWVVSFEGVADRTAAEGLRNLILMGEPLPGGDDELWVHELIGVDVRDRSGRSFGRVVAVEQNPAHDLLVLDDGALVPIVFVVDTAPDVVTIDPPEGLFDL